MKTFEESLNQAREQLEYESVFHIQDPIKLAEVVNLAANIFAAAAIKADRQRISQFYLNKATVHEGVSFSCPLDPEMIHNLPIHL
ncbi:hypothetical protein FEM33_15615 [Dyadobacter flavalbus]|uniref:Uncharacterized protein n=1 Tax=Dyadobacter flavalbus TaxID=2579942 RepID=A0A5M8QW30_9BACT|nr:hypothetical protein [Dyadobacter flavalbus]KAA6438846.1 hypothetical protein FEM33_15615 [Dyadobacter flavalbus]